jgi:myo-inositol-1(or 4)-monophosphatase
MDSFNWLKILKELTYNVMNSIAEVRLRGAGLELGDFKHALDVAAQSTIIDRLRSIKANVNLVSEEGDAVIGAGGPIIITDPVDGTTNLARGLRPAVTCFAVSETNLLSGIVAAVVGDLYTGEIYWAEKGKGAYFDGNPIKPSKYRKIQNALISIDISKTPKLDRMISLLTNIRYLRMQGSSAAEICGVSSGKLDAHIDIRGSLRVTDVAAALTILREAGGSWWVDGIIGGDKLLTRKETLELIVASSPILLNELISIVS